MRLLIPLLLVAAAIHADSISVNGKKLYYVTKGNGANTLFLIHGWACDHTFLDPQLEEFSKTHRVISIDLPGHGQSEVPTAANMDSYVAAIEAIRNGTKSNQIVLVGHSLGALIAKEYARLNPRRSKGLVLLDGAIFQLPPGAADRARWAEGITRMAHGFGPSNEKQVRERSISVFLSSLYTDETPRELRMTILRKVLTTAPETAEAAMLSMTDMKLWNDERVDLPVLALRAGRQQPPNEDVFLKTLFPRLQYKYMPGMSHFLMLEQPARVNTEIRSFLKASKL
jgi:pimeloyl-ACP methyl ester carboxylesterase